MSLTAFQKLPDLEWRQVTIIIVIITIVAIVHLLPCHICPQLLIVAVGYKQTGSLVYEGPKYQRG
jgi:hypothetical protein